VPVSPGWGGVSTVNFSGPGRHPISVQGAVTTSMDFPSFQSLEFNQPEGDFLSTPASADWNLGTTWTMEFWIKANNASNSGIHIPGGQWGLINQGGWYGGIPNNSILIGLAGGKLSLCQDPGTEVLFAEPTPGVWTHVAVVNNTGTQQVFYNGVEQTKISGNFLGNGWTNTAADLYIGRLSDQYGGYSSHFDGKMALVRISNTAKYLTAFTATTDYGVEADTRLFLNKYNPFADSSTGTHVITNHGVTTSPDFPYMLEGIHNAESGGNLGSAYIHFGDPNITAFSAIPIGARITSNLSGFGIRLVTGNSPYFAGQAITYDNTGLPGGTVSTTSDTYNFYW